MFDILASQNRKINKLKGWRQTYSKKEYPYKVVLNMFYELFSIELMWDHINEAFNGEKRYDDQTVAYNHLGQLKRDVQLAEVHQNLESFLKIDKIACGAKYSDFKKMIDEAQNGNNHKIIEIEYSYWYYCQYWEATIEWAAYGYLGYDKHSAFRAITGGDLGGLKLDTFQETVQSLSAILGISFEWKDADGNIINPMSNEAKNKKYYPGNFEFLNPLWSENSASNSKSGCFIATAVYGDYNAYEVVLLRKFRDDILSKTIPGKIFINIYYFLGPFLASSAIKLNLKLPIKKFLDYFIKHWLFLK